MFVMGLTVVLTLLRSLGAPDVLGGPCLHVLVTLVVHMHAENDLSAKLRDSGELEGTGHNKAIWTGEMDRPFVPL